MPGTKARPVMMMLRNWATADITLAIPELSSGEGRSYRPSNGPCERGSEVIYNSGYSVQMMDLLQPCGDDHRQQRPEGSNSYHILLKTSCHPLIIEGKKTSMWLFVPTT